MSEYRNWDEDDSSADDFFAAHMNAMTTESLHSKGEIAWELAFRDKRIATLEAALNSQITDTAFAEVKVEELQAELAASKESLENHTTLYMTEQNWHLQLSLLRCGELEEAKQKVQELERVLTERDGGVHDTHCKIYRHYDPVCTCGHDEAMKLLDQPKGTAVKNRITLGNTLNQAYLSSKPWRR